MEARDILDADLNFLFLALTNKGTIQEEATVPLKPSIGILQARNLFNSSRTSQIGCVI
jgi:hypothetical protein